MKKSLMVLLCLSVSYCLAAQEAVKQKEIGIVFSNLDNFGLTFKAGTGKSLWRINTLIISGVNLREAADSSVNKHNNVGFGVKLGKEYRKEIAKKLELRFGADLSFTYSQLKFESNDKTVRNNDRLTERKVYQPGVNLVFGLNYVFNENFVIGAELLPSFSYTAGRYTDTDYYNNNEVEVISNISGFNYGLSNASVLLSLAYRF